MTAIVRDDVDEKRRRLLIIATGAASAGAAAGVAIPFAASWLPSARALAAGAPIDADISRIEPGQQVTFEWRGKPVWVLKRTPEMLDAHAHRVGALARTADFRWWGDRVGLTVSIGASHTIPGETLQALLSDARQAMQSSAYAGGNQVTEARKA